jgi:cell division protein FtsX
MKYVKSLLAGILALFISTILLVVIVVIRSEVSQPAGGGALSFDVGRLSRWPVLWAIALLSFVSGFYSTYKHISRKG